MELLTPFGITRTERKGRKNVEHGTEHDRDGGGAGGGGGGAGGQEIREEAVVRRHHRDHRGRDDVVRRCFSTGTSVPADGARVGGGHPMVAARRVDLPLASAVCVFRKTKNTP